MKFRWFGVMFGNKFIICLQHVYIRFIMSLNKVYDEFR